MNTKKFKNVLRESLTEGVGVLFKEEEEEGDEQEGDEQEGDEQEGLAGIAGSTNDQRIQKLSDSLEKVKPAVDSMRQKGFSPEDFARAAALYFVGMNYKKEEQYRASVANDNVFNQTLKTTLERELGKKQNNIICLYSDLLNWIEKAKLFSNPEVIAKNIRIGANNQQMESLGGRVEAILRKGMKLSSYNIKLLKKLLKKVEGFDMKSCPSGSTDAPPPTSKEPKDDDEKEQEKEQETEVETDNGPVPIFKNIKGKGAKEGGRSLQSVLQNWINKNGGDFDNKVLQKAVRQIVMDISKQMKANTIEIQEATNLLSDRLNSLMERSNPDSEFDAEFDAEFEAEPAGTNEPSRMINRKDGFIENDDIHKLNLYIKKNLNAYKALKDYIKGYEEFDEKDAIELGLDAFGVLNEKLSKRREQIVNLLKKGEIIEAAKLSLIGLQKAETQLKKIKLSHEKEDGQRQTADNLSNHATSYIKMYDLGNKVVDMYINGEEEEEDQEQETQTDDDEKYLENEIFDKFKEILKRLDLHTSEGREAASADDQAYLGAFRYYKAMLAAKKSIENNTIDPDTINLLDKVEPLNEKLGENEHAAGREFRVWLGNMINIFKEAGLTDSNRAVKAMRAARGVKEPKEKERVVDPNASSGTVNTRQIIAPRLKAAGMSLDKNSPEGIKGRKFVKNIQKVIRRFIARHMKRLGKDNIRQITENLEKDLILKVLNSDIDFSNKDSIYESIDGIVLENVTRKLNESN